MRKVCLRVTLASLIAFGAAIGVPAGTAAAAGAAVVPAGTAGTIPASSPTSCAKGQLQLDYDYLTAVGDHNDSGSGVVCGSHSWSWNGKNNTVVTEIETPGKVAHQVLFHESLHGGPVWCFLRAGSPIGLLTIVQDENAPGWLFAPAAIQVSTKTAKCPKNRE
jgi:hypothetical protein